MSLVVNKSARREYEINRTYEAGIQLLGHEVKSLRLGQASLKGSHVKVIGTEAFLVNAQLTPYKFADTKEYDPKRTRKLLLKKKEIFELMESSQKKGWSVIPLAIEARGRNLKLVIGVGRGKKEFEKRSALKEKAIKRDMERELKGKRWDR